MQVHSELATSRRAFSTRTIGAVALLLIFGIALSFAYEYSVSDVTAQAQSASVLAATRSPIVAFPPVDILAQGAIVEDIDTRRVLYVKNADSQLPLASLTKVALVLVVSEVVPSGTIITIPHDTVWSSTAPVLHAGSHWSAGDLMSYTLVASSNDGAEILADVAEEALRAKYNAPEHAAVWRMNQLAQNLGLQSLYFLNPSGLDESATQSGAYGSARDVASLFIYAAQHSLDLFSDTTKSSLTITSPEGSTATAANTDELLDSIPGIVMGKTGYTDLAGGNLVVIFDDSGHRYVAAVLGSTEKGRFADMQQLVTATHAVAAQSK